MRSAAAGTATIILADFNQPLRRHYSEREWRAVTAGLTSQNAAVEEQLEELRAELADLDEE